MRSLSFNPRPAALRFLGLLLALCAVLAPGAGRAASQTAAPPASAPQQDQEPLPSYLVRWSIHGTGSTAYTERSGAYHREQHTVTQIGSAVVRPQFGAGGWSDVSAYNFNLTMEYNRMSIWSCQTPQYFRMWVTDPARYMGAGPHPGTPFPNNILFPMPTKSVSGTWTLMEPIDLTQSRRSFTHKTTLSATSGTRPGCAGSSPQESEFQSATEPSAFGPRLMMGDDQGKEFSMTYTYDDEGLGEVVMRVTRTVHVTRLDRCGGKSAPVDISDPDVDVLGIALSADSRTLLPDGKATIRAFVTCEGVPVRNASLEVGVAVQDRSGGHMHVDANRPRGYINGKKMPLGNLPAPADMVKTDARGIASFTFEPGRDTRNERIGIAGTYTVWVRSPEKEGYEEMDLYARVPELRRLFASGLHYEGIGNSRDHPENQWGKPATIAAVERLANHFWEIQNENNQIRVGRGEQPWPIVHLWVNDISLPGGGLFDVRGWDAAAGAVRGAPWQPPHYAHTDGTMVDFSTSYWRQELSKLPAAERERMYQFHRLVLKGSGVYVGGNWVAGPTLTWRPAQGLAAQPEAGGADIGVVALWADAAEHTIAAPGQTVTYTLGVHNMEGDSPAADVELAASLPAGLRFQSAVPAPTSMAEGQPRWRLGTLAAGAMPEMVTLMARVDPAVAPGTVLAVSADATTSSADAWLDNNHDAAPDLHVHRLSPDLAVASELGATALTPSAPISFTIDVANLGTSAAQNSTLQVTLPPSVTLVSASPAAPVEGPMTWSLGTIAPNARETVTLTVTDAGLLPEAQSAPLTFTMRAATDGDLDASNNVEQVVKFVERAGNDLRVGLGVVGAAADGGLEAGKEVDYTTDYGNYGSQLVQTPTITLSLPAGLSMVHAEPQATRAITSTSFPTVLGWDIEALQPGAEGRITVRVRVSDVTVDGVTVLAMARADADDVDAANNVASDVRMAATDLPPASGERRLFLPLVAK